MLGWFKKKFKKQEEVAPKEDAVIEDLDTETPLPDNAQHENDQTPAPEAPEPIPKQQEADQTAPAPTEATECADDDELMQSPSVDPVLPETAKAIDTDTAIENKEADPPERLSQPSTEAEDEPVSRAGGEPEKTADAGVPPADIPLKIVRESDVQRQPAKKKKSLFSRLTEKLGKTRETFTYQLDALFLGKKEIDAEMLDDLEEILITADLGVGTTQELLETARRRVKRKEMFDPNSLKETLKVQIKKLITDNDEDAALVMPDKGPFVIMVIGVNGVGKTTTIGKIARKFQQTGNSVMLVAGDTFRAAAVAQLKIWGERSNVPVIAHKEGADPSSVVFDALGIAQSKDIDVVIVDTAGRMHTKDNLMEELKKIKRVMGKRLEGAPHEIMLVIDATTGQNGISQARLFDDAVGVTGITLTKLDGTSKGGIVANICKEMKIPIRFIGIGEQMDDLRDFEADEFVEALFHSGSPEAQQ
ncbi:MAG: signal recognition particle-docking protein FtsY [Desulforhopalus sp.]